MPSTDQFYRALQALEESRKLTDNRRKMLKFHLKEGTITATQMANHMGQTGPDSYRWSNRFYGKLARLICEELRKRRIEIAPILNNNGTEMFTSVIAEIVRAHG